MQPTRSMLLTGMLLAAVAGALLTLIVMIANVARLGGAIAGEISRVQGDYLATVSHGPAAEHNALRLGQCVRRQMLRVARAGFVHDDTWAVATRVRALPHCMSELPEIPAVAVRHARWPRVAAAGAVLTAAETDTPSINR